MEKQAVNHFREKYLPGLTPSSPNIALFKNGQVVFILQRYQIEGRNAIEISKELTTAYDNFCGKKNSPQETETVKNYIEDKYQVKLEDLDL
jgi:hypothetical protein